MNNHNQTPSKITPRAIFIGLLLIPLNSYAILMMRVSPTFAVPFYNVILVLFLMVVGNRLWRRFHPKSALTPGELLVVYVTLSCSTALTSNHILKELLPVIGHPFWFATPENEWRELFFRYLPDWLTVGDKRILRGYYEGDSSFYTAEHLKAWMKPALYWSAFLAVLVWVMLCLNVIIRRQWTQRERLTYPVIQLPLEMVKADNALFRNQLLWTGFAVAAFITMFNGLNSIFPDIPYIPTKRRSINYLLTEPPWNALISYGYITVSFYPFMIGLGFLMPLDLSFSCWFFFVLSKLTLLLTTAAGWQSRPRVPFYDEQAFGAFLSITVMAIWGARRHLKQVLTNAFGSATVDDSDEPMSYRVAFWGMVGGLIFLMIFSAKTGMAFWLVCLLFVTYYALSLAVTRLRAELGFPSHSLWHATPYFILLPTIGTQQIDPRSSTIFSLFRWFNFDWASHPMPHQLEAFKFAEGTRTRSRRLPLAIMLATVIGTVSFIWFWLDLAYREGANSARLAGYTSFYGGVPFHQLQGRLYYRTPVDFLGILFTGVGFAFATFLAAMRKRFLWWQFHPLGYAMISDWATLSIWTCLLISSVLKWLILKYAGFRGYRRVVPFFLGVILGELVVGGLWSLTALWHGQPMYRFWP
jgi:hypothetical protein